MLPRYADVTNERISNIIRFLNKGQATASEITSEVGIPKSTINEYLRRMKDMGILLFINERVPAKRGCRYTYKLSAIGHKWAFSKGFTEVEQDMYNTSPLDECELWSLFFAITKNRTGKNY